MPTDLANTSNQNRSTGRNWQLAKRSAIVALVVALVALGTATVSGLIRDGTVPPWRSLLASVVASFVLTFALTFALNYAQRPSRRRSAPLK